MHVLLTRFLSQNLSLHLKLSFLESITCMPYSPYIILAEKTKMLNNFIIINIVMSDLLEILLCHIVKIMILYSKTNIFVKFNSNVLKHGHSVNFVLYYNLLVYYKDESVYNAINNR